MELYLKTLLQTSDLFVFKTLVNITLGLQRNCLGLGLGLALNIEL